MLSIVILRWLAIFLGGAMLVAVLLMGWLAWTGVKVVTGVADQTQAGARVAAELLRDVLHGQPRLVINQTTIWQETQPIAEFAVVSKEGVVEIQRKQSQYGSTKQVSLRSRYVAKAGFDLRESFALTVDPVSGRVRAELPPAKLLSVQLVEAVEMKTRSGWINWVTDNDRNTALEQLHAQTQRLVEQSGLVREAEEQALERLQELARVRQAPVEFRMKKTPTP